MITQIKWISCCMVIGMILSIGVVQAEMGEMFQKYLTQQINEFTLDNGMKFILLRQPEVPVFTASILVNVGSANDPPGKNGLAHFFEHMAFRGTTSIGVTDFSKEKPILDKLEELGEELVAARFALTPDKEAIRKLEEQIEQLEAEQQKLAIDEEFSVILQNNGAENLNAMTSNDHTVYVMSLPKNRLELWARMEVDRLMNPVYRGFYKEVDVIREELRMHQNSPSSELYEQFLAAAYNVHPYGKSVLGYEMTLSAITPRDLRAFHDTYYVPSNITVVVIGDIELAALQKVAEAYFSMLPKQPMPKDVIPIEPEQRAERTVMLQREAEPNVLLAWHMPQYPDRTACALGYAASILGMGRTSRMYKKLVEEKQIAVSCSASAEEIAKFPGLFIIEANPAPTHEASEMITAVMDELQGLVTNPPTAEELSRVKKMMIYRFLRQVDSKWWLAMSLASSNAVYGDWNYIGKYLSDIEQTTADEIVTAVKTYLRTDNRTIGMMKSKPAEAAQPGADEKQQQSKRQPGGKGKGGKR